ncbi:hypothetical protein G6F70_006280 [Rhizopus microsporus]|uniref:Peroxisome assembly protein 22 n=2 Tax=Rhizopus TaxID=4842 RepID=A0A367IXC6_RHIAZ|nr:hypothetical protein G6F71_006155 [Rhizopus microsporus]RCH82353.1 hypothetical protein CU097_003525 [Rhizopus azygosporus]KAG1197864.1 hypothetical protein G6F70_006280 [Rhizopus microsporus]KAG1209714.1 hypothetical protein G6F69_006103 [Rhizopus microsporus]KAG1231218.1 hypothetical protein G6F67_005906 [Rhizopus microsporus]
MSNNQHKKKAAILPTWVLRLIGYSSLAAAIISFVIYWFKKYPPRRGITSNERNNSRQASNNNSIGWSNKLFKTSKNKKKMTISLKNTVLWNPSSDASMYAFHENAVQLLSKLTHLYDIYVIIHVSSDEERRVIQSLLENAQLFTEKKESTLDSRKVLFCSEEEGKMHIIRHIEPSVHIEGGWERDDGEEIVKRLKPFVNRIIWVVTRRRRDSFRPENVKEEDQAILGHNIEVSEKLIDTSVACEVMQHD